MPFMSPSLNLQTTGEWPMAIGIVVIGRNEGSRLGRCFESFGRSIGPIVYVDSGSVDDSVDLAKRAGLDVVELDSSAPFSAARARNAGFERLVSAHPATDLVMFVDGDCEIQPGWFEAARAAFHAEPRLAAAAGRLRERFPRASIYNRLCDMEWHTPPGETASCGGVAVYRVRALLESGGFNPRIIAGEEPELCVRLRRGGWKIVRLGAEMALHDAAMMRFGQWWKRAVRAGHAYAEGAALHGRSAERHFVRESASAWLYGCAIPCVILGGTWMLGPWGLAPAAVYPLLFVKIAVGRRRSHGDAWSGALLYAAACVIAKPAECLGQIRYWVHRALQVEPRLLEHKPGILNHRAAAAKRRAEAAPRKNRPGG